MDKIGDDVIRGVASSSNMEVDGPSITSGTSTNGHLVSREEILELMNQRGLVDQQIHSLGEILKANHTGMVEPLTDADGFPRNDIDVYQVRHARVGIIRLQNDYKRMTDNIEEKLIAYHEALARSGAVSDADMEINHRQAVEVERPPIVKINVVSEGSPAFQAGLKVDDLIISFGSIDVDNFQSVQDIGNLVQRSQGLILTIKVKRNNEIVKVALIPGPWNGRGLLGCNIVPI